MRYWSLEVNLREKSVTHSGSICIALLFWRYFSPQVFFKISCNSRIQALICYVVYTQVTDLMVIRQSCSTNRMRGEKTIKRPSANQNSLTVTGTTANQITSNNVTSVIMSHTTYRDLNLTILCLGIFKNVKKYIFIWIDL